jgi:hypothetical protein
MLESAAPALLGPLNANAESVPDETSSGPALAMACSHYVEVQGGGGGGYGADESDNLYFTALLTSFANGYVGAAALHLQCCCMPQCCRVALHGLVPCVPVL